MRFKEMSHINLIEHDFDLQVASSQRAVTVDRRRADLKYDRDQFF